MERVALLDCCSGLNTMIEKGNQVRWLMMDLVLCDTVGDFLWLFRLLHKSMPILNTFQNIRH